MTREFDDVQTLSCTQEQGQHRCEVVYDNNLSTDVTVDGVMVNGTQKLQYNGGADITLDGKDCTTQGNVLVCE